MAVRESRTRSIVPLKLCITLAHALFSQPVTIETNNDHSARINCTLRAAAKTVCNTYRVMIVTCDRSSAAEAKRTRKKLFFLNWGYYPRVIHGVHHKVVLIFWMRRTRGEQASQNGCRRRSGRPSRDRQESTRSFRTLINYAWMRPNADVYSPWDNNLLRRAVFDIRSETGPAISATMTKYLRFTTAVN